MPVRGKGHLDCHNALQTIWQGRGSRGWGSEAAAAGAWPVQPAALAAAPGKMSLLSTAPLAKLAQGESGVPANMVRTAWVQFLPPPSTKHASCFPPSSMPASIEISIKLIVCLSLLSRYHTISYVYIVCICRMFQAICTYYIVFDI
jgi:hypothetical protein